MKSVQRKEVLYIQCLLWSHCLNNVASRVCTSPKPHFILRNKTICFNANKYNFSQRCILNVIPHVLEYKPVVCHQVVSENLFDRLCHCFTFTDINHLQSVTIQKVKVLLLPSKSFVLWALYNDHLQTNNFYRCILYKVSPIL